MEPVIALASANGCTRMFPENVGAHPLNLEETATVELALEEMHLTQRVVSDRKRLNRMMHLLQK